MVGSWGSAKLDSLWMPCECAGGLGDYFILAAWGAGGREKLAGGEALEAAPIWKPNKAMI